MCRDLYYRKGKGFQGGIKRHNMQRQPMSHGNSLAHRAIGGMGGCQVYFTLCVISTVRMSRQVV